MNDLMNQNKAISSDTSLEFIFSKVDLYSLALIIVNYHFLEYSFKDYVRCEA